MRNPTAPGVAPSPTLLRSGAWPDYALVDSGGGRKLERFGSYTVIRPEPQCLWRPRSGEAAWRAADAEFDPSGEEDEGRWRTRRPPPEDWDLAYGAVRFRCRLTSFRHLAVFPEQAANWAWLGERAAPGLNILNLFGYTGVASLVCAAAGARVTHVDASKRSIGWARENAALSGLGDRPVRWICDDALKFVRREARRGARYDGVILDPPKYGRGPDGEVWRLLENLPDLLDALVEVLSDDARFVLLNAYAERVSGLALAYLLAERLAGRGGEVDWGELALAEADGARAVGLSFFARWRAK